MSDVIHLPDCTGTTGHAVDTVLPAHSPLGASSAERWMHCPGSVALIKRLTLHETDEPDYRAEGTAAHEVVAQCLLHVMDAWEWVGAAALNGVVCTAEMADAVQVMLDVVRPIMARATQSGVEEKLHRPDLHALAFGTADVWCYVEEEQLLDLTDYKHGVGVSVDVIENPQVRYYGRLLVDRFPGVRRVRYTIVQPRGFHHDGIVRTWEESAESLCLWADTELLPAMRDAEMSGDLDPGEWCRFCPAKLICPVLTGVFGAAAKADPKELVNMGAEALGRQYQQVQGVRFYIRALEEEIEAALNRGERIPGAKIVAKKADRVWKDGAEMVAKTQLGDDAYSKPSLLSPARVEKLSPLAKGIVASWAYVPLTGTTLAPDSDKRPAITIRTAAEAFGAAVAKLEATHA